MVQIFLGVLKICTVDLNLGNISLYQCFKFQIFRACFNIALNKDNMNLDSSSKGAEAAFAFGSQLDIVELSPFFRMGTY